MSLDRRRFMTASIAIPTTIVALSLLDSVLGNETSISYAHPAESTVKNKAISFINKDKFPNHHYCDELGTKTCPAAQWCLAFCTYIYEASGVGFKHYGSAAIAGNAMKRYKQSSPKVGCLMFWDSWYKNGYKNDKGHVAIYIGDYQRKTNRAITTPTIGTDPTKITVVSASDLKSNCPNFMGYYHIGDVIRFQ
jgi:hypothetical protein